VLLLGAGSFMLALLLVTLLLLLPHPAAAGAAVPGWTTPHPAELLLPRPPSCCDVDNVLLLRSGSAAVPHD